MSKSSFKKELGREEAMRKRIETGTTVNMHTAGTPNASAYDDATNALVLDSLKDEVRFTMIDVLFGLLDDSFS